MQWMETHPQDLRACAGEWVVLAPSGILAHGKDYLQVRTEAISRGIVSPFIFRVPELDTAVYMGL